MKFLQIFVLGCAAIWGARVCQAIQPVYTNKTWFRIPYRFDAVEMQKLGAREVQLFVSTDRGVSWQYLQSVEPRAGRFEFEAPGDSEYWFSVRTLDGHNRLHPSGNTVEPGLKVTVDATRPKLMISLSQLEPGKVQLTWQAIDQNLDLTQLRLEYFQTGAANWQPVGIKPQASGTTSWSTPQGCFVAVRGTVADLASNVGQTQNQVRIAPAGHAITKPAPPDFTLPIIAGDFQGRPPVISPQFRNPASSFNKTLSPNPFQIAPHKPVAADSQDTLSTPNSPNPVNIFSDRTNTGLNGVQPRHTPATGFQSVPRISRRTRVVNAEHFQIGYTVDDVGPSGVSSVELYITQDDGQKWYKYGNDPDQVSPFQVKVPTDGVYGFSLRVRSGVGLVADPPQPGEKPLVVVVVDKTPPVVNIMPARQGQGVSLNKILIRWTVDDDYLVDRPIALAYATHLGGPWEPISGWQPNTGSYLWTFGPGVPTKLYLRVTARDLAGNISRAESPRPVVIDLSKPSARIVNVESITAPELR